MRSMQSGKFIYSSLAGLLLAGMLLGGGSVVADDMDDLSDNETCLDCHLDQEHMGLMEVEGHKAHNAEDGSLIVEAHQDMACIDCHEDIKEIPHNEDVERTVDCSMCHDEPHE